MDTNNRIYFCIDMKCFFASVECAERGLNPFETNLVVADEARGKGAICLAISPKLKSLGVKNRCRLYEIPSNIEYIIAKPRMKKYIQYAADIYDIYLDYMSPDDIHVYSIDESFIDATSYLKRYKLTAEQYVKKLIHEISCRVHIPATAGVGTNLYLAKIALDITAKKSPSHIGFLDEESFKKELWDHKPLTDFWGIAKGIANRLAKYNIKTMRDITNYPEELLYKMFGINAELLIDHAWGRESCTMLDIKTYKSQSKSISNSQILFEDYTMEKARIVMEEMTLYICERLLSMHMIAGSVSIYIGYSNDAIPPTGGMAKINEITNSFNLIKKYVLDLFDTTTYPNKMIRRVGITLGRLVDEGNEGYDFFVDVAAVEKERDVELKVLEIKNKFGKNAILRGIDLENGATAKIRNKLVGGHNGE